MLYQTYFVSRLVRRFVVIALLSGIMAAIMLPASLGFAAPALEPTAATVVALDATDDARTQSGSPTTNFGSGFLWVGQPNVHFSFVQFDLSLLPADATIVAAGLRLNFPGVYTGTNTVEVGRVDGMWDENSLTYGTQPAITWGGPQQVITSTGLSDSAAITWNVTSLVQAWHAGSQPNHGLALRGHDGLLKAAHSKETGGQTNAPELIIAYTVPAAQGARPDLGDAPDSSNHVGINNTAYVLGGVNGQFPTVWDGTAAGQPAGPRHLNQTGEGWLGDFLSREIEADQGPDQDGPNNILNNNNDVADRDRGDDGWRNRGLAFFNCRSETLEIRVSKAVTATRNTMYLNVWFDGNRDGDWADLGPCQPDQEQPAQAGYEWIVQNYLIDMTFIPAGGARDFMVNTERVFNTAPVLPHWMRFSLSELPAVQPPGGALPDGRGPHPGAAVSSFQFGETEDILHRASPPGEDGVLQLDKHVITAGEPVEWIDYVTYQIALRHDGGTQPIQAQIRDVLPYPLIVYPTIDGTGIHYVTVESATGGATPLQAQLDVIPPSGGEPPLQVVNWQGTLAPNAQVTLTFQVRVIALCTPGQQTIDFTNLAEAHKAGGAVIQAQDTFTAKCIGYEDENIEVDLEPVVTPVDWDDLTQVRWTGSFTNMHTFTVTLGIYQRPLSSTVQAGLATQPVLLGTLVLRPQETMPIDIVLRMKEDSSELMSGSDALEGEISFCFLPDGKGGCPSEVNYPNLHKHLALLMQVRPNDLGDAPDSSNHAGVAMLAYPAVPAQFPTVFDPATGLPEGPLHRFPGPFHLGQAVSREAEADTGPDQDPLNNLRPAANDPDNDRFDDGTNLSLWNLNHCQTTVLPVKVFISPLAVAYFQQLGTPGYLNIWLDSNRNGRWTDAAQCNQQPAPEHIAIDRPVNVTALGAGVHVINVPTGLVPWQVANQPAWVRITLSERLSNKTLVAGALAYGDGRGYAVPFKTGETEDFLYYPQGADGGGPDLAVNLAAKVVTVTGEEPGLVAAAAGQLGNFEIQIFRIDYENLGSIGVQGALLEFQIPEKLRDMEIILAKGTDVAMEELNIAQGKVSLLLPYLEQSARGSVVLGWYGCITCTRWSKLVHIDAIGYVTVTATGDVDAGNNSGSATLAKSARAPMIGAFMDYTDDSCMDRIVTGRALTNQSMLELRGRAEPNRIIAILIGLVQVGTATSDNNGNFSYPVNLAEGVHRISARYPEQLQRQAASNTAPFADGLILEVKPALPFDPMSVCFVDSHKRAYFMPQLGHNMDDISDGNFLRSGESYTVSLRAAEGAANTYFKVTFEDILVSELLDSDRDGFYTGKFTVPEAVQAAEVNARRKLGLVVRQGSTETTFTDYLDTAADGVIRDRSTGLPLAGATVVALVAEGTEDGNVVFGEWPAGDSGQPNPQTTAADGKYGYSATTGVYRLQVERAGYQPYRSGDIDAESEILARDLALAPVVADPATQTIYITDNGFVPAAVTVAPGSVVEFVNIAFDERGSAGSGWDSGLLHTGQGFKVRLTTAGAYAYGDSAAPLSQATITVAADAVLVENVYLPLVGR